MMRTRTAKSLHHSHGKKRQGEKGNVFFYILLGIILFAALAFTVSRGMQGQTTKNMTRQQAQLAASEILSYARTVEHAVNKLRRNRISESDISFENASTGVYNNPNCTTNDCKVFHPDGGRIQFRPASDMFPPSVQTTEKFQFNGGNRIATFGCNAHDAKCSDLFLVLNLNDAPEVCLKINDLMEIENPSNNPPQYREWYTAAYYAGTFTLSPPSYYPGGPDVTNDAPQLNGKTSGCFFEFGSGQNNYTFYHVLLAR